MSDETTKPESNEESSTKSPLLSKEKEEMAKNIVVKSILWITMIGLFVTVLGGLWAIGDIFSQDKFASFLELEIQTKLFFTGLILLGIFFLVLFLLVLYKRGKANLMESLFKEAPEKEVKTADEYLPAKIITAGALISFFVIFVGLIVALLQFMIGAAILADDLGFWSFMSELTGGSKVLIIGLIILILDGLIYGMLYIWQNGYYLLINKILRYNQKVEEIHDFSKNERIAGKVVFGIIVMILVALVFGIVWAIIESFTGDWGEIFRDYIFGVQLSIIGLFGTLTFGTLISAMFVYKWGNNVIMKALFIQYTPKSTTKDNLPAKMLAVGILVAIVLLASSLIIWVVTLIVDALTSGGTNENIFTLLADLSGGLALLAYSLLTELFVILILIFIFFLHNGYAFTLLKIMKTEEAIDAGLDISKARAQEKKDQRIKNREVKKADKDASKK